MRFRGFRELVSGDMLGWIRKDLAGCMKDLFQGLTKLNFEDNFETFSVTLNFLAGEELVIENSLNSPPSKRIIIRQIGNGLITDGTIWTSDRVSLINNGSVAVTATIVFMR